MPSFNASPFAIVPSLYSNDPFYFYGSHNANAQDTTFKVTSAAIASNVATLHVSLKTGLIPVVGALITVVGYPSGQAEFNVTNVALTGVTISTAADATSGTGTLTLPITHADVSTITTVAAAIVPQPEVPEALANGASALVAAQTPAGAYAVSVTLPSVGSLTAVTIDLQESITRDDAGFNKVATVASYASSTLTGGYIITELDPSKFYRLNTSGLNGTGTVVAKIVQSKPTN